MVELADLDGDVVIERRLIPRSGEPANLHREPKLEQLVQQFPALEDHEGLVAMYVQVVVLGCTMEDADPCIPFAQRDISPGDTDFNYWNFRLASRLSWLLWHYASLALKVSSADSWLHAGACGHLRTSRRCGVS